MDNIIPLNEFIPIKNFNEKEKEKTYIEMELEDDSNTSEEEPFWDEESPYYEDND